MILATLANLGEEATEAYLAYEAIESHKAMKEYNKHANSLNQKPFSAQKVREYRKRRNAVVSRYGSMIKKEYGWAKLSGVKAAPGSQDVKLRDLEKRFGQRMMRPYYRRSSYAVHAGAKSILTGDIANAYKDQGMLLVGPSYKGFEDALQLSMRSLAYATIEILYSHESFESAVLSETILRFGKHVRKIFSETL